eukprot:snap_masked-scaffold_23-processed-gene-5.43-mRNA-1 protein AED:1.00 eAED:1.00 QI:0/0/0/0/1/1/4/0/81
MFLTLLHIYITLVKPCERKIRKFVYFGSFIFLYPSLKVLNQFLNKVDVKKVFKIEGARSLRYIVSRYSFLIKKSEQRFTKC